MKLLETKIDGMRVVDIEQIADDRGFFARAWCRREFTRNGIDESFVQANIALNRRRGTLRGLHYQEHPHWESKLVRCTRGASFVVVVDLRGDSPTHCQWVGVELDQDSRRAVYVGQGCALGYQALDDATEMFYQMSTYYVPTAARGVRYDDPAFGITWPLPVSSISEADRNWSSYSG